ncbi:MAG: zinc-binding dehydrogenase [Planctomycetota bacterium]|jgi:L-iditol 2-dehydrogenase
MKVAVLRGIRDVAIEDVPVPEPGPGEVRVRVTRVGVCGSDVHYYSHGRIGTVAAEPGHVAGHELAGVVDARGPGVEGPAVGARVAVEPAINCGECERCLAGFPNQCLECRFISLPPHKGAFCEYICHPARLVDEVPDSLTDEDIAQLEPLGVGVHAAERARVGLGETVAVFGCGPIGLFTLQAARAAGASRIFATDVLDYRVEFARKLGADEVMNASGGGVSEWIMELTRGRGADVTIDCAGVQDTIDHCVEGVGAGGRVALVGSPREDLLSYLAHVARRKELDVLNVRRSLFGIERALPMALAGQVDLRTMVTHRFPLEETGKAFDILDRYADGVVKAMIAVSDS